MNNKIINKITNSNLITIDLESFFTSQKTILLDVKSFLENNTIKEKEFRQIIQNYNWETYKNKIVCLYCSIDTIIPMWVYMLIVTKLKKITNKIFYGNKEQIIEQIIISEIDSIEIKNYKNKKILIKGCSNYNLPESIYIKITQKLQNIASSIMFGEACSAVPILKNKKYEN